MFGARRRGEPRSGCLMRPRGGPRLRHRRGGPPSTYLGEPARPSSCRSKRGRNAVSTVVVAGLVAAGFAWTATGHSLLPASTPSSAAASPTSHCRRTALWAARRVRERPLRSRRRHRSSKSPRRFGSGRPLGFTGNARDLLAVSPYPLCRAGGKHPAQRWSRSDRAGGRRSLGGNGASLRARRPYHRSAVERSRAVPEGAVRRPVGARPDRPGRPPTRSRTSGSTSPGEAGPQGVRRRNGQRTYVTGDVYLDAAKAAAWQRHGNASVTARSSSSRARPPRRAGTRERPGSGHVPARLSHSRRLPGGRPRRPQCARSRDLRARRVTFPGCPPSCQIRRPSLLLSLRPRRTPRGDGRRTA